MTTTSRNDFLATFREINGRAGVDPKIINICESFARQTLRSGNDVDFYNPQPSFEFLTESAPISDEQRKRISEFWNNHKQVDLDEKVIRVCIAYVGNLMLRGVAVLLDELQLAHKLDIPYETLVFMSSNKYKSTYGYRVHFIPKKRGFREIDAPSVGLKRVQRWILENILAPAELHDAAHGFRAGRSIISNAKPHTGKDVVINLDLHSFFHAISFSRVLGIYLELGYTYDVAILLTRLTTYGRRLPQGAPSSPALSNLASFKLDRRLAGLAKKLDYSYTRYADDLTFSATKPEVSPSALIQKVQQIVSAEGFQLAQGKISVRRKGAQQVTTGLVVNKQVNVSRKYRRQLRAAIHNALTKGLDEDKEQHFSLTQIEGHISFITSVNARHGEKLQKEFLELLQSSG